MTKMQQIEEMISKMTRSEKAYILQLIVGDLGDAFPDIESNETICGGEPCIVRTRIPVWVLVQARKLGTSESDLLKCYPTIRVEDLASAWAYYRAHREEIERQIQENESA